MATIIEFIDLVLSTKYIIFVSIYSLNALLAIPQANSYILSRIQKIHVDEAVISCSTLTSLNYKEKNIFVLVKIFLFW